MKIKDVIEKIEAKINLSKEEMKAVFDEIMSGAAEKSEVKEFLSALKAKGESLDEIVAAAEVMRERMVKLNLPIKDLVDTCGTGGALIRDINISTISAIVLAACGAKVAKHGNRSFTGECGSADLLEELGVDIHMKPAKVARSIEKVGFGFMFAPDYHPAMKNVTEARRELKTKTIFNILGPLANPAGANIQILGVYEEGLTELVSSALGRLGGKLALVVHGLEGLDEISIKGKTKISELKDGKIETFYVRPGDFGIEEGLIEDVKGLGRRHNAAMALGILNGKKGAGRDMVLLNTAAALRMIGKVETFKDGVREAADSLDSKRALDVLERLRKLSN